MKAALILSAAVLTACCTQPAPAPAPEEPARMPSVLIGTEGLEGLSGQVPFTLPVIERTFPGFDIVTAAGSAEPAFHVREPGQAQALFIVTADWSRGYIGQIATRLPGENTDLVAGTTRFSDLPETVARTCSGTPDPGGPQVTCDISLPHGALTLGFQAGRDDPLLESVAYTPARPGR